MIEMLVLIMLIFLLSLCLSYKSLIIKRRTLLMSNILGKDEGRKPYTRLKRENINVNDVSKTSTSTSTTGPKPKSGGSGTKKIMNQGLAREQGINNPNKLRIIAGTAKGKKIESPDMYLRPMMAKVREALYSTLNHMGLFDSNTTKVLDTFSGSGSVGLEALSRGAAHVTFVDFSQNCIDTALRNADSCGFPGQAKAVCARVEEVFTEPLKFRLNEPYQLVSITPPYKEVSYPQLINDICNSSLVCEDTIVIIEYPVEMGTLPYILGEDKLFGIRNRKYGRTVLGIYVYRPNKKYDMRPEEFTTFKK